MKIYSITIAAVVLMLVAASIQHNIRTENQNNPAIQQDTLYACGWFPLCTDPDKKKPELKPAAEKQPLYACGWFPLCTDPDQRKPALQPAESTTIKQDIALA